MQSVALSSIALGWRAGQCRKKTPNQKKSYNCNVISRTTLSHLTSIMSDKLLGLFLKTTNLLLGSFSNAALVVEIKERSWSVSSYRFGVTGKEKNDEGMGGGGATYDNGFRIYNPQLGKFLSVDPLFRSYPWYTPYQFAGNMPIAAIDLDGLEELIIIRWFDGDKYMGETAFRVHNPEQREPNKRNGGDLQIIELDISQRESFDRMVNSLNITKVENVIKNEDGTFKGEYFKENKIHSGRNKVSNNEDNKQVEAEQKYGAKQKRDISGDVVRFKHNSDDIIPLSNKTIEDIKRTLNAYPDKQIGITGYASIEGNNEDNVNLFLKRALKVKEYLVNNDIDPIRILYVEGAGTTEKYDNPNNNEDQNLEANRVVEINITYEKTQAD